MYMWRILYEIFRSIEKLNMKCRTMVFLIFVVLLIGSDVFLIYKITMEKTSRSNATTSFTTRLTTHESTTVATRTTTTNTPSTASTTNVVIVSAASTTNASTSATSASLSSRTISSSSVTAVKSQTTESTLETNATTNSYTTTTMTTAKESTSETMPIDTTKNTAISTRDSSWTRESTTETPTSTSKVPKTTSEQITTETENTEVITTTEVTTDADTTTHATVTPCNEFNYVARDANTGVACVQANMTIQINLRYMTNYYRTNEAALTVPRRAKTSGTCGEKTAEMILSWKDAVENQTDVKENKITFRYSHDDSTYFLDSTSVDVHLDDNNFPNAQHKRIREDTMGRHLRLFSTSMKHRVFIPRLGAEINVGDWVNVLISNISLIAFASCSEASNSRADGDYVVGVNVNNNAIAGGIIGTIILILIIFFLIWCKKKKNAAKYER